LDELPPENWIKRILAGDRNAFEMIFDQYKNLVFKTAYLKLDNASKAEDALQKSFLIAYRSLRIYNPSTGAFSTWLYRITVNHCLNQRWKFLRLIRPREIFDEGDTQDQVSLEKKFSDQEVIERASQKLSQKLRVVIILRYFLDLSYAENSQVLDFPLGTVKSRLNLGLHKVCDETKSDLLQSSTLREVSK
jgi:RNA polymerase sigma-70 factor (ECF subfamily)